jgi:xeroderma pigmentosum group C-complementing protein
MSKRKKNTISDEIAVLQEGLDGGSSSLVVSSVRRSTRSQSRNVTEDQTPVVPKTKEVKEANGVKKTTKSKANSKSGNGCLDPEDVRNKQVEPSEKHGSLASRGSRYFERFKNKLVEQESIASTSQSCGLTFDMKSSSPKSKRNQPSKLQEGTTIRSNRNARKTSPYFTPESGVSSMVPDDSDSDDDFEEVESREIDPFELLEREQQQSQDSYDNELVNRKTNKKSKKTTSENSKAKKAKVVEVETDSDEEDAFDRHKPSLPEDGLQVELEHPLTKRRKKDRDELKRMRMNRMKKWMQENLHKSHFLCLLSRGIYLNRITIDHLVQGLCLSHISFFYDGLQLTTNQNDSMKKRQRKKTENESKIIMNPPSLAFLKEFVRRFKESFDLDLHEDSDRDELSQLIECLKNKKALTSRQFTLAFIAFIRCFRLRYNINAQIRLVQAMTPLPIRPKDLLPSDKQIEQKTTKKHAKTSKVKKTISSDSNDLLSDDGSNVDDVIIEEATTSKANGPKQRKKKDNDYIPCDIWTEVFLATENRWIPVDPVNQLVDQVEKFESVAEGAVTAAESSSIHYFLSFDDEGHVKECSNRYASKFLTGAFNRPRADSEWIEQTLASYRPKVISQQDIEEDEQINRVLSDRALPKTVSDFKGHPLVVLKRHILVYEAIYPPDTQPIGHFREEPIYSRHCIKPVRSELYWKRQARVLKEGVFPYKTVKGRKKWDRFAEKYITDLPNELYGEWQTDPYDPPVAVNGIVPRNQFGNVELFQPCMLPIGTVHLNVPGLARIAAKLGIDCVAAVTGFDNAKSRVVPVIEGWVVCQEFKDILLDAFKEEKKLAREKKEVKRLNTVYANWRRLTRALLVREKLNAKYADN